MLHKPRGLVEGLLEGQACGGGRGSSSSTFLRYLVEVPLEESLPHPGLSLKKGLRSILKATMPVTCAKQHMQSPNLATALDPHGVVTLGSRLGACVQGEACFIVSVLGVPFTTPAPAY